MATLNEQLGAAHWGIEPLPDEHRKLTGLDLGVLWANLGIGLLVVVTGGLLPALYNMSLAAAVVTVVIGSALGCLALGLAGMAGSREGVPTMALLRPVLGDSGSAIPSVLNAAQLVGWTAFELWAMALVADLLTERLFGFSAFHAWVGLFSAIALAFSLWGPLGVVRAWMERFATWVLAAMGLVLTLFLFTSGAVAEAFAKGGGGGSIVFGIPLDLVIAMPVSWLPLVADYNRFCKAVKGSFWGTFGGYMVANIWFYSLGIILVMSTGASPDPGGVVLGMLSLSGITLSAILLLTGLLVGESDQAFADVYSGAVSLRNIFPKVDNRVFVVAIIIVGALLASVLSMDEYEFFLFLLGSVFVPLFGVWFADYFLLKNRRAMPGWRAGALIPWIAGFTVYHWIVPTELEWWKQITGSIMGQPLSTRFPWLGASLPSFASAFLLHGALSALKRTRKAKDPH